MEYAVVPVLPLRSGFPNLLLSSLLLPLSTDVVVSAITPLPLWKPSPLVVAVMNNPQIHGETASCRG